MHDPPWTSGDTARPKNSAAIADGKWAAVYQSMIVAGGE